MDIASRIFELFAERGDSNYGGEDVTQKEHALQAAWAAEKAGSPSALVTAALVHDIGHLLHDLAEDAPDHGVDDRHEASGNRWLAKHFGPEVCEPVRLHVAAKRYLCAVDSKYYDLLSEPSKTSLKLQGGPFDPDGVADFEKSTHWREAAQLRRWDDEAKNAELVTPDLEHFREHISAAVAD